MIEKLRQIRKQRGLTLRQVEEMTGISNAYLSQLETGKIKKPSHHVVQILYKVLGEQLPIDGIVQGWPSPQIAKKLLLIRDELVKGNAHEAYHQLCLIADPELTNLDHWNKLETIAHGHPSFGQRSEGTGVIVDCSNGKHFWSKNEGVQECLLCPARREASAADRD